MTIFPKHPHEKGRSTIVLEVEGAPPAQAARAGKCLPAAGQGHVPGDGDLHRDLGSPAVAAVHLEPEAARSASREFVGEEAGKLDPAAGRVRRPHDKLRQHLRRVEARCGGSRNHPTRGTAKLIEYKTYLQALPYFDRLEGDRGDTE